MLCRVLKDCLAVQIFMFVSDGNEQAEPSQTYEKDLSTVDEVMTPANLVQNHDEFINAIKLRLTKLEVIPFYVLADHSLLSAHMHHGILL